MSNYTTLLGAEDVRRAGAQIESAALDMRYAANTLDAALSRHEAFLQQWLLELNGILQDRIHDMGQALK